MMALRMIPSCAAPTSYIKLKKFLCDCTSVTVKCETCLVNREVATPYLSRPAAPSSMLNLWCLLIEKKYAILKLSVLYATSVHITLLFIVCTSMPH